jgi:hypothetical protein
MYICLMSYEKTELLTLGDYMSNIAGVLCIYVLCLMRRPCYVTHIVTKDKDFRLLIRHKTYIHKTPAMSNIAGVLCRYVLCLMRRQNSSPLVTIRVT